MIVRISGKLVQKREQSLILGVNGLSYEVMVPASVAERVEATKDIHGNVELVVYHYLQLGPSTGIPVLIGFTNEIEKDFFQQFISVSGIGPRAAIRALNKPISEITRAIHAGDIDYLRTLPGIGAQKAKEIVAKLQGKMGKFGLIQDQKTPLPAAKKMPDWQEQAIDVLLQLQYKKSEAREMIEKALARQPGIQSAEELLNEIYNQRIQPVQ